MRSWVKVWISRTIQKPDFVRLSPNAKVVFFASYIGAGYCDAGGRLVDGGTIIDDRLLEHWTGLGRQRTNLGLRELLTKGYLSRGGDGVIAIVDWDQLQETPQATRMRRLRRALCAHSDAHSDASCDAQKKKQKKEKEKSTKKEKPDPPEVDFGEFEPKVAAWLALSRRTAASTARVRAELDAAVGRFGLFAWLYALEACIRNEKGALEYFKAVARNKAASEPVDTLPNLVDLVRK